MCIHQLDLVLFYQGRQTRRNFRVVSCKLLEAYLGVARDEQKKSMNGGAITAEIASTMDM